MRRAGLNTPGYDTPRLPNQNQMVEQLRESLEKTLDRRPMDFSMQSRMSYFDLNDLPYISQMRSLLLIVYASSFIIAPIAYMPLATIQSAFEQKCFLYTTVRMLGQTTLSGNRSTFREHLVLDALSSSWGRLELCDFTTFVPVSVTVFSIILGMSTVTIWPSMMSLGKGGALMIVYTFLGLVCLIACSASVAFLYDGYSTTCQRMKEETGTIRDGGLSCYLLNNVDIQITEVRNSRMCRNVHRVMIIAQIIGWCLVGLMVVKVIICILTFIIIWFYLNGR